MIIGDFYDCKIKTKKLKNNDNLIKSFIENLLENNAFELKDTVLKSGVISPFYINMRLMSNPRSLKIINMLLSDYAKLIDFDYIVAVPYAAIPFATLLAQELNKPLLYIRKEKKEYGDNASDLIVGKVYDGRKKCLLVDDVLTNGKSKYEQIKILESGGFLVKDVLTLVDRTTKLENEDKNSYINILKHDGVVFHSVLNILDLLEKIQEMYKDKFNDNDLEKVYKFLGYNYNNKKYNRFAKNLLKVFSLKNNYIVPSVDFEKSDDLLGFIDLVGKYVGLVKIHSDIVNDWSMETFLTLKNLSNDYNFYILEDKKFVDIGSTMKKQLNNKHFSYKDWVDCVTVVPLGGGESIVNGLESENNHFIPAFVLTTMTTVNSYYSVDFLKYVEDMYINNNDKFCGLIGASKPITNDIDKKVPFYIWLRPGISESESKDNKGQSYIKIDEAYKLYGELLTGVVIGRDLMFHYKEKNKSAVVEKLLEYNEKVLKYKFKDR